MYLYLPRTKANAARAVSAWAFVRVNLVGKVVENLKGQMKRVKQSACAFFVRVDENLAQVVNTNFNNYG